MESLVDELYHQGCGYRAITRLLRNEHGVSCHYTTVKRVLKRLGVLNKPDTDRCFVVLSLGSYDAIMVGHLWFYYGDVTPSPAAD